MYSKYHNKKIVIDNITFASLREGGRYRELKLLQKAGAIKKLTLQPEFELLEAFTDFKGKKQRGIKYIADFSYFDTKSHECIIEDCKGMRTDVYKLKKKFFLSQNPFLIFREI